MRDFQAIAWFEKMSTLDATAINAHQTAAYGIRRLVARFVEPRPPQPTVDPNRFGINFSALCQC